MKTEMRIFIQIMIIAYSILFIACCKEPIDESDSNFIVVDFKPDSIINKDDTMFIDINKDGKFDLKAFQHKYSSSVCPIFESVDTSCSLSLGFEEPPFSYPSWNLLSKGDTINNQLTWVPIVPWTIGQDDSLNGKTYLAIKLIENGTINYGWLLSKVQGYSTSKMSFIIDEYVFCKITDKEIKAGQEIL